MKIIPIVVAFLFFLPVAGQAEGSSARLQAASELLRHMEMERQVLGGAEAMADAMVTQNPMMRPFRSVIVQWAATHMTWENLEPDLAKIYADAYSESEIQELIAFYKSPVGKKSIQLGPELMRKGALLGSEVAQKYSGELQEMVKKRAAELEESSTPRPK